jgi:hypothetical protein
MSTPLPESLLQSQGAQYAVSKGWGWTDNGDGQIKIDKCPICGKDNGHFYMATSGNKDGLWFCHFCGKTGNLKTLKEELGDAIRGVDSRSDWAGKGEKKIDALPDINACHIALLNNADALDYLINVRGFTSEIIKQQKLGLKEKVYFKKTGEVTALVIPYLVQGNIVFAKYRTLPPADKDFITPHGWESPLYNGEILREGCQEIIFVEGEADAIAMMSKGIMNVVGVPGANVKKAAWIETLDQVAPEKIYILYDNDKVGTKAAQVLASRIGIDKCLKLVLPEFGVPVDVSTNTYRKGKDINEWFRYGEGTVEAFEKLKAEAKQFDVTGVTASMDALEALEDELNGKEDLAPKYVSQYPELNRLVGFEDGDVIDIVAPEKVGKTTFGMNLIDHMVKTYNEPGLIVCLEMTQARLARKWVSMVTGFEDNLTVPGSPESKAKLEELKIKVKEARLEQQHREADLYFAYPQLVSEPEDVFKLIRDCIRRYGVRWVMFDNLQRLCDDTLKNQAHRTVHLSQISKQFAKLAKDYQIKLIRILQPKRIEKGMTMGTNDVDGSSQVAKDCDCMITMWRAVVGEMKKSEYEEEAEGFSESSESYDPKTKIGVGLSRYSSGGHTYLECKGSQSRFTSYPDDIKRRMPSKEYNQILNTEAPVVAPTVELPKENISI